MKVMDTNWERRAAERRAAEERQFELWKLAQMREQAFQKELERRADRINRGEWFDPIRPHEL